ncbi:MAG: acyltransferase [Steroidobacteraceae bacterium]|nr:acyltransferase [Steroidobacteraceae bacterium]
MELPNLDALRALAVLLVLADHVLETIVAGVGTFDPFDRYLGRLGVLLFFVHTCFVLMISLERHGSSGWSLARAFYIRRVFRLYPLAIVCVLAVVLIGVPARPWDEFRFPEAFDFMSNLALTMNLTGSPDVLAPLWTLPVELQMYVLLPGIYLLVARDPSGDPAPITALYLLSLGAALLLPSLSPRLSLFASAPAFMAGVVAYVWGQKVTPRFAGWAWLPFLAAIVGVYIAVEELTPGVHHIELAAAITLLVGLAIPMFAQSSAGALNRVARTLARYSYGVYLFNLIALWAAYYALPIESTALKAATALGLLVAFSVAGYHLVEAPMMKWGHSPFPSKRGQA